jgi:hypothetical protein
MMVETEQDAGELSPLKTLPHVRGSGRTTGEAPLHP